MIPPEEKARLKAMLAFERAAYRKGFTRIAGLDEAGRGPLAGPVVAAACILPKGLLIPYVDDSKKLTPKKRSEIFHYLIQEKKISYGIGIVSSQEIDQINIYQATIRAMHIALSQLLELPDYLLVDGMHISYQSIPCLKIIKGDQLSKSIAAASIIAKETQIEQILEIGKLCPNYNFKSHKGYATPEHLEEIREYGPSPYHRFSFAPVKAFQQNFKN